MVATIVRFTSKLTDDEVQSTFEDRADAYRQVPGLAEKLYLRFRETGEYGAVYVWESEEALAGFRTTELARSIPDAYRVDGATRVELADVRLVIGAEIGAPAPS